MIDKTFFVNVTDPLAKYMPKSSEPASQTQTVFNIWKLKLINEFKINFYQFQHSLYILAIAGDDVVYGVWDVKDNIGYLFYKPFKISPSINIPDDITKHIPEHHMSLGNQDIFDVNTRSEHLKSIEYEARQILQKMSISPEHRGKTPTEMVVRSIQLASEFDKQFKDFSDLHNSNRADG
jgi:hypothetical protein